MCIWTPTLWIHGIQINSVGDFAAMKTNHRINSAEWQVSIPAQKQGNQTCYFFASSMRRSSAASSALLYLLWKHAATCIHVYETLLGKGTTVTSTHSPATFGATFSNIWSIVDHVLKVLVLQCMRMNRNASECIHSCCTPETFRKWQSSIE